MDGCFGSQQSFGARLLDSKTMQDLMRMGVMRHEEGLSQPEQTYHKHHTHEV